MKNCVLDKLQIYVKFPISISNSKSFELKSAETLKNFIFFIYSFSIRKIQRLSRTKKKVFIFAFSIFISNYTVLASK